MINVMVCLYLALRLLANRTELAIAGSVALISFLIAARSETVFWSPPSRSGRTKGSPMTDEELAAARLERARRWLAAGSDLRGYPTLAPEDETEETLAAAPPEKAERKPRNASEPPAAHE